MGFRDRLPQSAVVAGLLLGVTIFSGCGASSGTVKGTVTGADGQLLKVGQVEIHTDKGVRIGQVEENGIYTVYHVPLGKAKVSVRPGMPPAPVELDGPVEPGKFPEKVDATMLQERDRLKRAVPEEYQRFDSTPLELHVQAGSNDFPIQLKP